MKSTFRVKSYGESFTDLGVLYSVIQDHGRCGCGLEEMISTVAYFRDLPTAHLYCDWRNGQTPKSANAKPPGAATHAGGKTE